MKRFASLIAVLLLVAAVTVISAQEKEAPGAEPCTAIDSETRVKLEKLKLQYELSMVDLKAEKNKIHEEMMAELLKEEPSTKTIEKLGKSMNGVQYKMHKAKIDYILKVKKILPADHWKAFLHKKHAADAGHSMGCAHSTAAKWCCPMAGTADHKCGPGCVHDKGGHSCGSHHESGHSYGSHGKPGSSCGSHGKAGCEGIHVKIKK